MKRLLPLLIVTATATATLAAPPASGGSGAAELHLDGITVTRLVAAALPGPFELRLPGLGAVPVELGPPANLRFSDGAVEMNVPVRLPRQGIASTLFLRYRPEIEPLYGVVHLVAEHANLDAPSPFDVDLSPWVGSLPLPREAAWDLELDGGNDLAVRAYVQDVRVAEERLVLVLGVRVAEGR